MRVQVLAFVCSDKFGFSGIDICGCVCVCVFFFLGGMTESHQEGCICLKSVKFLPSMQCMTSWKACVKWRLTVRSQEL